MGKIRLDKYLADMGSWHPLPGKAANSQGKRDGKRGNCKDSGL